MKRENAGTRLRYCVLGPLGPTRFGDAHLALVKDGGSRQGFFALEMLRADWARDDDLRALFLDEAAQTLSLEHPNVVRTQEVLLVPGACGRVTRWFAGHTLAAVLERVGRERFPLHLHVRVLCEVLSALQYLHELEDRSGPGGRLLYRDLSPSQVLVTYTGQIKILGAGFQRTIDQIERRSGQLFSDVGYASPELCLGYPASPSADVYSVGVMLWEALAQTQRVFASRPEECVRLRIDGEEPDVEAVRAAIPKRLAQICGRALAVSPRDRYASAQELQIDLESFLADTETDAQQNAGLGALAQLMVESFVLERSEMLAFIEQQLAEPESGARAAAPEVTSPAGEIASPASEAPLAAPAAAAPLATSTELSPISAPEPRCEGEAAALERSEREPETHGHRAYSSTLRSKATRPASLARAALPAALAAVVVLLLVARSVRLTQSAAVENGELAVAPEAAMQALTPVDDVPEPMRTVEARAGEPSLVPLVMQAKDAGHDAFSAAAAPVVPEATLPVAPEATLPVLPEATLPAVSEATLPVLPEATLPAVSEATLPAASEAALPVVSEATLPVASEAKPAVAPARSRPRFRRRFKRMDSRAAGPSGARPRVIDEADPYLD